MMDGVDVILLVTNLNTTYLPNYAPQTLHINNSQPYLILHQMHQTHLLIISTSLNLPWCDKNFTSTTWGFLRHFGGLVKHVLQRRVSYSRVVGFCVGFIIIIIIIIIHLVHHSSPKKKR